MKGSATTIYFLGQMADAGDYRAFMMGMASFLFKGLVWDLSSLRALESRLPWQWYKDLNAPALPKVQEFWDIPVSQISGVAE